MADHQSIQELVALYVLRAVDPGEHAAVEDHLRTCAECLAEARSLAIVPMALAQSVPQVDPPPSLRDRVLSTIGAQDGRRATSSAAVHGPASPWGKWLALAAGVLVVVGGLAYASLRTRLLSVETQLQSALVRLNRSENQIDAVMRSTAGAESRVAVISAPDVLQVSLAGQPPAPGAVGRAFWSRSRGLVFAAASLPPLPGDRTYQLWYLTSGAPVSAGLFRPDSSGRAVVTVDPPPGGVAPTGLAVSNEPAAGVPAPTGPIYLAGMTH